MSAKVKLLERVIGFVRAPFSAAADLPPPEQPKVKKGPATLPSYLTSAQPPTGALPRADRQLASTDITTLRTQRTTYQVLRSFIAANPDLSAAVFAYIRAAVTSRYVAVARNRDGTFNRDATNLLQQILARFDVLGDYKDGFSGIGSMRSNSEQMAKEILTYGACSCELVLDKARLPRELAPVSVTTLQFKSDGVDLQPIQKIGDVEIDLDVPTFFYVSLDQDLLEPYSSSPMESAIQPALFATEFMNDLRRVVKKAIHPRVTVEIDYDLFVKAMPSEAQEDEVKRTAYMNAFLTDLESKLNGLEPEDALVYFNTLQTQYMTGGNTSLDAEYRVLSDIVDAKLSTGSKTMPSILGHASGSNNIASTETMLFMKSVGGAVQEKLNEIYSRALTLAVRLFGQDVVVEFRYDPIDLRPDAELEAFKVMRQDRLLKQLSLGFITDEECGLALTGSLPPPGMTKLSGTMFMDQKVGSDPNEAPYSNQSTGGAGGGAGTQQQKSNAPKQAKGGQK